MNEHNVPHCETYYTSASNLYNTCFHCDAFDSYVTERRLLHLIKLNFCTYHMTPNVLKQVLSTCPTFLSRNSGSRGSRTFLIPDQEHPWSRDQGSRKGSTPWSLTPEMGKFPIWWRGSTFWCSGIKFIWWRGSRKTGIRINFIWWRGSRKSGIKDQDPNSQFCNTAVEQWINARIYNGR